MSFRLPNRFIRLLALLLVFNGVLPAQQPVDSPRAAIELEGEFFAKNRLDIRNKTGREMRVLKLVEEGTQVEEGDVLFLLDGTEIEQEFEESKRLYMRSDAELSAARSKVKMENECGKLNLELLSKQLDLVKEEADFHLGSSGRFDLESEELEARISMVETKLDLLKMRLESTTKASDIEKKELELAIREAAIELRLSKRRLEHLKSLVIPFQQKKFELQIRERQAAIQLAQAKLNADRKVAEADFRALQLEHEWNGRRAQRLSEQLKSCDVRAPQSGQVFYFRDGGEPIREGSIVEPKQVVMYLPELKRLHIRVMVPKGLIKRVRQLQNVAIEIDGKEIVGLVNRIAPFPDAKWPNDGKQRYEVIVAVVDDLDNIRPGQTCVARFFTE